MLDLALTGGELPGIWLFTHEDRPVSRARGPVEGLDSGVIRLAARGRSPGGRPLDDPGPGRRPFVNLGERPSPAIELDSVAIDGGGTFAVAGAGSDNLFLAPARQANLRRRDRRSRRRQPVGRGGAARRPLRHRRSVERHADLRVDRRRRGRGGDAGRGHAGAPVARRAGRAAVLQPRAGAQQRGDRAAVALHLRRLPRRRAHRRAAAPGQAEQVLLDDARPAAGSAPPRPTCASATRRRSTSSPTTSSRRTRRGPSAIPRTSPTTP